MPDILSATGFYYVKFLHSRVLFVREFCARAPAISGMADIYQGFFSVPDMRRVAGSKGFSYIYQAYQAIYKLYYYYICCIQYKDKPDISDMADI
jgi:hypothetical protein